MVDDKLKQGGRTEEQTQKAREADFTRRQMLYMGWTVPVIAALALYEPNAAFAASGGTHDDAHSDGHSNHWD